MVFLLHDPFFASPLQSLLYSQPSSVVFLSPNHTTASSAIGNGGNETTDALARTTSKSNLSGPSDGETSRVVFQTKAMSMVDNRDNLRITMDLPGVKQSDVKVTVQGYQLNVAAQRKHNDKVVAQYSQQLDLDENASDTENVQACLVHGVLTIVVPKKKQKQQEGSSDQQQQPTTSIQLDIQASDVPPVDKDNDGKERDVRFAFDVPGVKIADIKASIASGGTLIIDGERKGSKPSRFHRTVPLDTKLVDAPRTSVFLADGVLTVVVPRKEPAPVKTIAVSTVEIPKASATNTASTLEHPTPEKVSE